MTLATAEKHPYLLSMYERWEYERISITKNGRSRFVRRKGVG
ncbi:hypothetical protein MKY98_12335 [Paenibacillus sp. FSL M8-0228]|nr:MULTISPECIES: hypothetical protein [Paenibacillus]